MVGFYNMGDRVRFWGTRGAFWGGFWGLFFGGLFLAVPVVGHVVVLGYFATIMFAGVENAVVTGGLSALGAALYSLGVPKNRVASATVVDSTQLPAHDDDLRSMPLDALQARLKSSTDGLSQEEAARRLGQYGPNEIEEKKSNPLLKFLSYFWGPIPWMIEAAVVLSGIVRHWPDFFIILLLLVTNAVIGFWEERQAGNAIEALKAKLAIKARVKRDGRWVTPAARELAQRRSSVKSWVETRCPFPEYEIGCSDFRIK